jgi:hypothetical protein
MLPLTVTDASTLLTLLTLLDIEVDAVTLVVDDRETA